MGDQPTEAERQDEEPVFDTLPPFANAKNKEIDRQLREKEKLVKANREEIETHESRTSLMTQHMKNVQAEITSVQALVEAKGSQVANEDHLAKVAVREAAGVKAEIERIQKEEQVAAERAKVIEVQKLKALEKMEEHRRVTKWTKQEMEKWTAEQRVREEDKMAILKYQQADEVRVKELSLAIEKMSKETAKQETLLESHQTEAKASQIELSKMEQSFKDISSENQRLVQQCEESLVAMQARDKEISLLEDTIRDLDRQIGERQALVRDKQRFLEGEQANNVQVENELDSADRQVARKRDIYGHSHQDIEQLQDELETVKMTLQKSKATLDERRASIRSAEAQIVAQQKRLAEAKKRLAEADDREEEETKETGSLETKANQLEQYLKQQENKVKQMDKELEILKQETFKANQELAATRQKEANLTSEISGVVAATRNLRMQIRKLDSDSMKQQEVVYNQEFQLQELEHRIARASGIKTSEEKAQLNARIQELTTELEGEQQKYQLLNNQYKRVLDEVKVSKREVDDRTREKQNLETKIQTLLVETETAAKTLKNAVRQKEDLLLQENIVRLDVRRLRDLLYKHADEVYSLETFKHEQAVAIEEAKHQYLVEIETLKAQLKTLNESSHATKVELKTRQVAVDKLRSRYELLVSKVSSTTGEHPEELTQESLLIKAAQEKEELRRQGDVLNEEIDKLEKDTLSLEAMLSSLNGHTQKLMEFNKPQVQLLLGEKGQKEKLEQDEADLATLFEQLQAELREVQSEAADVRGRLSLAAQEQSKLISEVGAKEDVSQHLKSEIAEQEAKLDRARRQFKRIAANFKKGKEESLPERELVIAKQREAAHAALYGLTKFTIGNPDLADEIKSLAGSMSLELPSSPVTIPSAASTPSGSRASSTNSSRGGGSPTAAVVSFSGVASAGGPLPPTSSSGRMSPGATGLGSRGVPRQTPGASSPGRKTPGGSTSPTRAVRSSAPTISTRPASQLPGLSIGGTGFTGNK